MNTEVMNLYRERGVNPASGCVPMLLTMPVLLAFYSLLSQSIELRGAPFAAGFTTSRRRSVLRDPAADGRHDVLAAEDHADDAPTRRSSA